MNLRSAARLIMANWRTLIAMTAMLATGWTLYNSSSPSAQDDGTSNEDKFLEFFVGNCLLNMPDVERIRAAARVMKWKPLEGDMAVMMAPTDPEAVWKGWVVSDGGEIYMLGVSESGVDGERMVSCTAAGRYINQEHLVQSIVINLRATLIYDDIDTMQRYRVWTVTVNDLRVLLTLTTAANRPLSPAASLSAVMDIR